MSFGPIKTGDYFSGVNDKTFSYLGIGTQILNEVAEIRNSAVELLENSTDQPAYGELLY